MIKSCMMISLAIIGTVALFSCKDASRPGGNENIQKSDEPVMCIQTDSTIYNDGDIELHGYTAVDTSTMAKKPIVLIVPEWWGVGDYVKHRALMLAELGYYAMVVDMYGNGTYTESPLEAGGLATPFYKDPLMAKKRFDAALTFAKSSRYADTNRIAAIGYCFGGAQVLNVARLGENLNGVVSFHGDLVGVPPMKGMYAKVLICHGDADSFVDKNQVATFKKQMDSVGASYVFKSYANATHAFTNPDATRVGKKNNMPVEYNAKADTASWNDMKAFFKEIF